MKRKLAIDPGHGLGNRTRDLYDPGACAGTLEEAGLVLSWAHCLRMACADRGIETWMTRNTRHDACPVFSRAARAVQEGCTHLISLHINCADVPVANGFETLHGSPPTASAVHEGEAFAEAIHATVLECIGLRDRGVKVRRDLAVLKHHEITAAMLELGFISNERDMKVITSTPVMQRTCRELAARVAIWFEAQK
jgi:N-acetylmuramoyl-L-alanine amidase